MTSRTRPSAPEAVQNGNISVSFRCFTVLHWASGGHATVKMTSDAANAGSFFSMAHVLANRKYFLEFLRSVVITNCVCRTKFG